VIDVVIQATAARSLEGYSRRASGASLTAAGTSGSSEGCATRLWGDRRTLCAWGP